MVGQPTPSPEFAERFEAGDRGVRMGPGLILGLLLVAIFSGLLAWWLSSSDRGRMSLDTPTPAASSPRPQAEVAPAPAADQVDTAQVRRAYDEVRTAYAEGGAAGLVDFARECSGALAADRRILDFCLAFDLYAEALAPKDGEDAAWFAGSEARHLKLLSEALPPGADPALRLGAIRQAMRTATGGAPAAETAVPELQPAPELRPRIAPPAPARPKASAAKPAKLVKPAKAAAPSRCRFEPTPAQRILCANPALKTADGRMQRAYRQAVAAGADRQTLDSEQAAFRTARNGASNAREMQRLYAQRIRELQSHARR